MKVQIKILDENAVVPTYGSEGAAGADLYAVMPAPIVIESHETQFIRTGIAIAIPEGYVGLVYPRSGIASKRDLAPANKVGVIDSDYRGEIMVALHNHGYSARTVDPGERIAQLVIALCQKCEFVKSYELADTARGEGGFGSTGV